MCIAAHEGREQARRDDLETLVYILFELLNAGYRGAERRKIQISTRRTVSSCPRSKNSQNLHLLMLLRSGRQCLVSSIGMLVD